MGHFVKQCKSLNHCRLCQKPYHTLLQVDQDVSNAPQSPSSNLSTHDPQSTPISSSNAISPGISFTTLLMTCRVNVSNSNGIGTECRALLDSASSASFASERLAQRLHLPRSRHKAKIMGIAGLQHGSTSQAVTHLVISPIHDPTREIPLNAAIMPRVTCNLPLQQTQFKPEWTHLSDLTLADPDFGQPDQIDLLLGIDVFSQVICHSRWRGPPGSPSAFETKFGWVLAGETTSLVSHTSFTCIVTNHSAIETGDEILQRFWKPEERPGDQSNLSVEERNVMEHFKRHHSRTKEGRFIVPLAKKSPTPVIGESRSQAVRRFRLMERSLHAKGQFDELSAVMNEYFENDHAELVTTAELDKPTDQVFYMPMHVVRKESSSTTKLRAVFDASAPSSTGTSLNNTLLIGPTVHSTLFDVLLKFQLHRIAITADVSRMYCAVLLHPTDKDLHWFVWRASTSQPLHDYRMTRITFGVAGSSFVANMAVKQNAQDLAL